MSITQIKNRAFSFILIASLILSSGILPAQAASISDGNSTTVTITMGTRYTYLESTEGVAFGGEAWTYKTNDGIIGPAYCIDWGLKGVPADKQLTIGGLFTVNPKTIGAFAGGYPQRSLDDFLTIYLGDNPELAGLTEAEFGYSTQLAVWSTLKQIAVQGTAFTEGRATLAKPTSDAQKIRTFRALEIILGNAAHWDRALKHSMTIRNEKYINEQGFDIQYKEGLFGAAKDNAYGRVC